MICLELGAEVALATGLDPKACHFSMHPEEKHQWVKQQEDAGETLQRCFNE